MPRREQTEAHGPRQRRRDADPKKRGRYRRRRGIALLVVVAAGAALFFALEQGSEETAPIHAAVPDPDAGAKRAARIELLERRLAQAKKAAARAAATPNGNGNGNGNAGASFEALIAELPGEVGIAYSSVGSDGEAQTLGSLQSGSAWSTVKVALAARVVQDAGGVGGLSSSQRSLISSALRLSDNAAAMSLWQQLVARHGGPSGAAGAVGQVLADAGDTSTVVSSVGRDGFSPYGQTDWSLAGQARFMAALAAGCVPGSAYLLDEMGQVASDQRWGLGQAGSDAFKGGWGPGTDGGYLVRQMGTVGPVVVAIAALPADGQFVTGQEMLTRVAHWSRDNLRAAAGQGC